LIDFFFWVLFLFVPSGQYLTELLEERQKLGPFMQVLPICSRLLNQGSLLSSLISICLILFSFRLLDSGAIKTAPLVYSCYMQEEKTRKHQFFYF